MTARRPHNDGRAPATIRKTSSGNRVAVWKKTRQGGEKPHERDERALVENNKTMDDLYKERQDAIAFGADSEIVKCIGKMIMFYQEARLEIMAQVPGASSKGFKGRSRAV